VSDLEVFHNCLLASYNFSEHGIMILSASRKISRHDIICGYKFCCLLSAKFGDVLVHGSVQ